MHGPFLCNKSRICTYFSSFFLLTQIRDECIIIEQMFDRCLRGDDRNDLCGACVSGGEAADII